MPHITPTSESLHRLKYAREIAELCPESLFNQIALTGSSARGIATESSDIEINFWVDTLPDRQSRVDWIASLGVTDIVAHSEARPDNSYWINGNYKGIELEGGWQTFADLEIALTELIEARTTNHKALRLAELILSAKHLRGIGTLEKWQSKLQHYPEELSQKLIESALTNWLDDNWREHRISENSHKEDIHRIWRIIFALNHQWEVNWKYASHNIPNLQIYPKKILERIWDINKSNSTSSQKITLELIADILELIKTNMNDSPTLSNALYHLSQL